MIGTCPEFSKDETELVIKAAWEAFKFFQTTTARERSRLLRKWHDLVIQNLEDISILITLENGKPLTDARGEVAYAASFLEWFSEEAPRVYGNVMPVADSGNQVLTVREPVGVCALITP